MNVLSVTCGKKKSKFKTYDKSTLDDSLFKQQSFEMRLMRKIFKKKGLQNHVNTTLLSLWIFLVWLMLERSKFSIFKKF